MIEQLLLLLIVFVPTLGAFLLPALGALSVKLRNLFALLLVAVSFVGAIIAAIPLLSNGAPYFLKVDFSLGIPGLSLSFGLLADGLAVFMALVSSLVGGIIVLYSWGYISHYEKQNEYYLMVVLFIGSMMGIVFSTNLIFLFIFWEISTIACWRLIGFFREKNHVLKADKAFLVTVFGALIMLVGFIMVYAQTGTFELTEMRGAMLPSLAVLLILFGIFSKSATLPLHTWLPDAGVAPSPVTSLLHAAVLVKIGVYVFARLFVVTFQMDVVWNTIIPIVAAVSALVAAGAALIETDLKRIIAYSTVSQIGFIFLGLAVGNKLALAGGLLYILMHGIAKGGLFLCAGIVEQNAKTKKITELGGLASTMPITAVTFIVCAFSVMGIPPLGGFWSKYMVIGGAVNAGQPWIALTFIVGAVLTIMYLLRAFTSVFLGKVKISGVKEGSPVMLLSVVILATLSLIFGIFINLPSGFVDTIISQLGVIK